MSLWQEVVFLLLFFTPPWVFNFTCSQANFLFLISLAVAVQAKLVVGLLSKASSGCLRLSIFLHLWPLLDFETRYLKKNP